MGTTTQQKYICPICKKELTNREFRSSDHKQCSDCGVLVYYFESKPEYTLIIDSTSIFISGQDSYISYEYPFSNSSYTDETVLEGEDMYKLYLLMKEYYEDK